MIFQLMANPGCRAASVLRAGLLAVVMLGGVRGGAACAAAPTPTPTVPPTQAEMEASFLNILRRLSALLAQTPGTVVAEIGDRAITRADVADALNGLPPTNGARTLDRVYHDAVRGLIAQKALAIRAREQGIDKDPAVMHRITAVTDTILANEYLRRAAMPKITERMLHEAYEREVASEKGPEAVSARVIMLPTRAEADKVQSLLAHGADFADVATRFSKDASAPGGGDIGFVHLDSVLPGIGAVMFALAPGQMTAFPVWAAGAWYIIKVEARRQEAPPSFEAVRGRLVQQLTRAGLPLLIQKAMAGLAMHDYGITGKDSGTPAPGR